MLIRPDELLTRIRLPRNTTGATHYYRKVGTRKARSPKSASPLQGEQTTGTLKTCDWLSGAWRQSSSAVQTENALKGQKPDAATVKSAQASLWRDLSH